MIKIKIKKGDTVKVIAGKDKGAEGEVMAVYPKLSRALVSGVGMIKKHMRATKESEGGIISRESSIHISNLALLDPSSGKKTRVGYKFLDDKTKVRYAKASGEVIASKK